jgi:hypothetical protein
MLFNLKPLSDVKCVVFLYLFLYHLTEACTGQVLRKCHVYINTSYLPNGVVKAKEMSICKLTLNIHFCAAIHFIKMPKDRYGRQSKPNVHFGRFLCPRQGFCGACRGNNAATLYSSMPRKRCEHIKEHYQP